jgi:hypothetical protein
VEERTVDGEKTNKTYCKFRNVASDKVNVCIEKVGLLLSKTYNMDWLLTSIFFNYLFKIHGNITALICTLHF